MTTDDVKKFSQSAKKTEALLDLSEKKTLSIRLTDAAIEKLDKRVDKLKKTGRLARKATVSSYISELVDTYARLEISERGEA